MLASSFLGIAHRRGKFNAHTTRGNREGSAIAMSAAKKPTAAFRREHVTHTHSRPTQNTQQGNATHSKHRTTQGLGATTHLPRGSCAASKLQVTRCFEHWLLRRALGMRQVLELELERIQTQMTHPKAIAVGRSRRVCGARMPGAWWGGRVV